MTDEDDVDDGVVVVGTTAGGGGGSPVAPSPPVSPAIFWACNSSAYPGGSDPIAARVANCAL